MTDLRAIIANATPGPWSCPDDKVYRRLFPDAGALPGIIVVHADNTVECIAEAPNAAFISTFDPTLVSALLDVVEAAEGANEWDGSDPATWPRLTAALSTYRAAKETP